MGGSCVYSFNTFLSICDIPFTGDTEVKNMGNGLWPHEGCVFTVDVGRE